MYNYAFMYQKRKITNRPTTTHTQPRYTPPTPRYTQPHRYTPPQRKLQHTHYMPNQRDYNQRRNNFYSLPSLMHSYGNGRFAS